MPGSFGPGEKKKENDKRTNLPSGFSSASAYLSNLSDRYANSVKVHKSETIPRHLKHLVRMQDFEAEFDYGVHFTQFEKEDDLPDSYKLVEQFDDYDQAVWIDTDEIKNQSHIDSQIEIYNSMYKDFLKSGWRDYTPDFLSGVDKHFDVFMNGKTKEAYLAFHHYSADFDQGTSKILKNIINNDISTEDAMVLRNIPLNETDKILKNPHFSPEHENYIRKTVDHLKNDIGLNVKFTGYSLGGYTAKYFGSKLNIDQEVFNAHVMPHNTFEETSATTTFHTIATDETSFKYLLPSDNSVFQNDKHIIYPPSDNVQDLNLILGNVWGNHLTDAVYEPESSYNLEQLHSAPTGETLAPLASKIGVAAGAAGIGTDIINKNYVGAAINTAMLGTSGLKSEAPAGILQVGAMGYNTVQDFRRGEKSEGARHGLETAAIAGAFAKGGGKAAGALGLGVTAIESGISSYRDAKAGRKGDAAAHGVESAVSAIALGSAAAAPETAGLSVLVGGIAAGAVELEEAIRHAVMRKRKSRNPVDERSNPYNEPPPKLQSSTDQRLPPETPLNKAEKTESYAPVTETTESYAPPVERAG